MNRARVGAIGMGAVVVVAVAGRMLGAGGDGGPVAEPVVVAEPALRMAAGTPDQGWTVVADSAPAADDPCAISLEAFAEEGAMIGLTLLAPCRANQRVVLRHGGLVLSMQTLATGSLFATLPAMEMSGAVEVRFDDGTVVGAAAVVPELAGMRRFAVQWQETDRFAVNGFAKGADYGDAGHATVQSGGVMALGDAAAVPALLAEVYTFPDPETARVTVEAEVTATTCGRELLGETIYSAGGAVRVTDLTLAMPECDATGGFVVLNNPLPDMTLAAAE